MLYVGQSIPVNIRKATDSSSQSLGDLTFHGVVTLQEIDLDHVLFSTINYDTTGKIIHEAKGIRVNLNESIGLDGSPSKQISYTLADATRPGLEGTRYLNFLRDEEAGTTALFSLGPDNLPSGDYAEGILAINPSGSFLIDTSRNTQANNAYRGLSADVPAYLKEGDVILDSSSGSRGLVESDNKVQVITQEQINQNPEIGKQIPLYEYAEFRFKGAIDPKNATVYRKNGKASRDLMGISLSVPMSKNFVFSNSNIDMSLNPSVGFYLDAYGSFSFPTVTASVKIYATAGVTGSLNVNINESIGVDLKQVFATLGAQTIFVGPIAIVIDYGQIGGGISATTSAILRTNISANASITGGVEMGASGGLNPNNWYLPYFEGYAKPIYSTNTSVSVSNTVFSGTAIIKPYIYYNPSISLFGCAGLDATFQIYLKNLLTTINNATGLKDDLSVGVSGDFSARLGFKNVPLIGDWYLSQSLGGFDMPITSMSFTANFGSTATGGATSSGSFVPITSATLAGATLLPEVPETLTLTTYPVNAWYQSKVWSSSNPELVGVNSATGLITPHAPGTAVITVTFTVSANSPPIIASTPVIVNAVPLTGITIGMWMGYPTYTFSTGDQVTVNRGSQSIQVKTIPSNATVKNITITAPNYTLSGVRRFNDGTWGDNISYLCWNGSITATITGYSSPSSTTPYTITKTIQIISL